MTNESTLATKVRERIAASVPEQQNVLFSPAVVDAMKLADMFESIKPQEYILPLDAMVGFPAMAKSED
jgi:hypothetical protein